MKRNGFTLVELIITMVMGGIIFLAMGSQFVAESRFRAALKNEISALGEARLAINHMARTLRFAVPSTVTITSGGNYSIVLGADIEGGHISSVPVRSPVSYRRYAADNTLEYIFGADAPAVIASNITDFNCAWDNTKSELTIKLTTEVKGERNYLETKIRALGS